MKWSFWTAVVCGLLTESGRRCRVVRAFDIGAALKKLSSSSPSSSGDTPSSSSTKSKQIRWNSLEYDPDASTGTITQHEPGREKEPVTCNEIMAKAVVLASEEKAAALSLRNEALDAERAARLEIANQQKVLQQAQAVIDDMKIQIEEADMRRAAKVSAVQKEMNEMLLNATRTADRLVQEAKDEAMRVITEERSNAANIKAESEANIQSTRAEAQSRLDRAKKDSEDELAQLVKGHHEEMMAINSNATKLLETAQSDAASSLAAAKAEAAEQIARLEKAMEDLNRTTTTAMDASKEDAETRLAESARRVSQIIKDAKASDERVRAESKKRVDLAEARAADKIARIREECDTKIVTSTKEMERLRADTERRITSSETSNADKIKAIEKERAEYKAQMDAKLKKEHASAQMEIQKWIREHSNLSSRALSVEEQWKKQVDSLEETRDELKEEIAQLKDQVKHWENRARPYCNTTLIRQDSKTALSSATSTALMLTRDASKRVVKVTEPSLAAVKELYDQHLAETVNEKVVPIYETNVRPIYESHVHPAIQWTWKYVASAGLGACVLIGNGAESIHSFLVRSVDETMFPHSKKGSATRDDTDGNNHYAEDIVDFLLISFVACLMYRYRSILWSSALKLGALPFRILWFFFWPRLLFQTSRADSEGNVSEPSVGKDQKSTDKGQVKSKVNDESKEVTLADFDKTSNANSISKKDGTKKLVEDDSSNDKTNNRPKDEKDNDKPRELKDEKDKSKDGSDETDKPNDVEGEKDKPNDVEDEKDKPNDVEDEMDKLNDVKDEKDKPNDQFSKDEKDKQLDDQASKDENDNLDDQVSNDEKDKGIELANEKDTPDDSEEERDNNNNKKKWF